MAFAIKAEISDPRARAFAFNAQKTMYGKLIAAGDIVFRFASENESGKDLIARGVMTSAAPVARKPDIERQTPRVSIALRRVALATRPLGRDELKPFKDWNELYRQATNKIVGITEETAAFLDRAFEAELAISHHQREIKADLLSVLG
ncbi:hypothetical protein [Bradyrhizobium sp. USDA 4473]